MKDFRKILKTVAGFITLFGLLATSIQAQSISDNRVIVEGDVYKIVGSTLYVMNRYRGLQIIDISDLDHPRLVGRAPIFGWPKEMYVRGNNAYVIVSDNSTFGGQAFGPTPAATIAVVNIDNPNQPQLFDGIELQGEAVDSRIVGNILYIVSNRAPWYSRFDNGDTEEKTQIQSIDISNPANVRIVDTKEFPRNGYEHHTYITPRTIYLASAGGSAFETNIRYVDISDPSGVIRLRGEAVVPGRVQDRWSMDEYEGVLRVASGQFWGNGDIYLNTFSVTNPDDIVRLGGYTLQVNDRLASARFDGFNAYLVCYRGFNPLFQLDVGNPAAPRLVGELEMAGWLDFLVPMGDRIVALGHEAVISPSGERQIRLAVSRLGVSRQTAPRMLSRVRIGETTSWVPFEWDDFAKVFRVLGEQGLIVFPFQSWNRSNNRLVGEVQLIDLTDPLVARGQIEGGGLVWRSIPLGERSDILLTLSDTVLQVIDIRDRDHPRLRSRLLLGHSH